MEAHFVQSFHFREIQFPPTKKKLPYQKVGFWHMFCIHFLCGDIEKMNKEPMLGGKPKFSKSRLMVISVFFSLA